MGGKSHVKHTMPCKSGFDVCKMAHIALTTFLATFMVFCFYIHGTGADQAVPGTCLGNQKSCSNTTKCYYSNQRCDGEVNRIDGSDEVNCPVRISCNTVYGKEGYLCGSGECTLKYWFCDGSRDCADGSDEDNCDRSRNDQSVGQAVSNQLLSASCQYWVYYNCGFKYPSEFLKWKVWDDDTGYTWTEEDFDEICSYTARTLQCVRRGDPLCWGIEEGLEFYDHVYDILCQPPNITFAKALIPCFNDPGTQVAVQYYMNLTKLWDFYGPGSEEKPKDKIKKRICQHTFITFESHIMGMIHQNCDKVWTDLIVKGLGYRIKEPFIRKYGDMSSIFCNVRVAFNDEQWAGYLNPTLKMTAIQMRLLRQGVLP